MSIHSQYIHIWSLLALKKNLSLSVQQSKVALSALFDESHLKQH